jgi:hypothetical protein
LVANDVVTVMLVHTAFVALLTGHCSRKYVF